jgi:hypothetical protein
VYITPLYKRVQLNRRAKQAQYKGFLIILKINTPGTGALLYKNPSGYNKTIISREGAQCTGKRITLSGGGEARLIYFLKTKRRCTKRDS